jgi:uncharacterized protein (DUF4415 family)
VAPRKKKTLPGARDPRQEAETASLPATLGDRVQEVLDYQARRSPREKYPSKTKTMVSIDNEVIDHFKALGNDWKSKMNEALREMCALGPDRESVD